MTISAKCLQIVEIKLFSPVRDAFDVVDLQITRGPALNAAKFIAVQNSKAVIPSPVVGFANVKFAFSFDWI